SCPTGSCRRTPWPIPPRTTPTGWHDPAPAPATPTRTDRASPGDPPGLSRRPDARRRRRRATWVPRGRPASRPEPRRRSARALLEPAQQTVDLLGVLEPAVELEAELRRHAYRQLLGEPGTEKPG